MNTPTTHTPVVISVEDYLSPNQQIQPYLTHTIANMAGSRILAAASEAKKLRSTGVQVTDLTIGDYSPDEFSAPIELLNGINQEIQSGRNNYPPSDGMPELQSAIRNLYTEFMGVTHPDKTVVICGGARPPIYAAFRCLISAGDKVAFPVPSWNSDYYTQLVGAECLPIVTTAATDFMPTPEQVATAISDTSVRMFVLNTPNNPTGSECSIPNITGICKALLSENQKRAKAGQKPVWFLFDMVYWPLSSRKRIPHPLSIVPELAPWTITIDAMSKWLVGTGLRLGWAVVPPALYTPMRDFMGHVGSWAPRPVQVATATYLQDTDRLRTYLAGLTEAVRTRQDIVFNTFCSWQKEGLPVEAIMPMGAIYVSVRFDIIGRTVDNGVQYTITTNDQIRKYILNVARVALVSFQAFGLWEDTGWFRVSVGAVGTEELIAGLSRIKDAISCLPTSSF